MNTKQLTDPFPRLLLFHKVWKVFEALNSRNPRCQMFKATIQGQSITRTEKVAAPVSICLKQLSKLLDWEEALMFGDKKRVKLE